MKKIILFLLLAISASSFAQEEFFYKCDDGTQAHQYLDANDNPVMDFHGVTLPYTGINMANEISFRTNEYSLSMKPLSETRFNLDLLGRKTHYATNCEQVTQ